FDCGGPDLTTGSNRPTKDAVSLTFMLYGGTTQLPPTPAGPESSSATIRLTGASPSIQLAATSDIPSGRTRVLSSAMPVGCCCGGAGGGAASSFILARACGFSPRSSDLGGMAPRLLNQQCLPSISRHDQWTPASPAVSRHKISAGAAVVH